MNSLAGSPTPTTTYRRTNFWRSSGVSGLRLDLNPQLTVPWRLGDISSAGAAVGAHETVYDVSGHKSR